MRHILRFFSSKNPVQEEPLMAEMKTTAAFVFEVSFFFLTDVIKKKNLNAKKYLFNISVFIYLISGKIQRIFRHRKHLQDCGFFLPLHDRHPSFFLPWVKSVFRFVPVAHYRTRWGFDLLHTLNLLQLVYFFQWGRRLMQGATVEVAHDSVMENIYESVPMSGQWAASREQRHLQNPWRCCKLQASVSFSYCVCVTFWTHHLILKGLKALGIVCVEATNWQTERHTVFSLFQNGFPNNVDILPSTGHKFYYSSLWRGSRSESVSSCLQRGMHHFSSLIFFRFLQLMVNK